MSAESATPSERLQHFDESVRQVFDWLKEVQFAKAEDEGMSLLDVKNHQLMSYIVNLTYLVCRMSKGESIAGDGAVERLVELRTVLEKMRPIEQRMKLQIDNLIKAAKDIGDSDAAPRPHPELIDADGSDSDADGSASDDGAPRTNKYVPPKLVAVPYGGDDDEKAAREAEKSRRRALSSSLLHELHQQFSDRPEEIRNVASGQKRKQIEERKERDSFEEEHMMRMQLSKKQLRDDRRQTAASTLDSLLEFGQYDFDDAERPSRAGKSSSRGRRFSKNKRGKAKSKHRGR